MLAVLVGILGSLTQAIAVSTASAEPSGQVAWNEIRSLPADKVVWHTFHATSNGTKNSASAADYILCGIVAGNPELVGGTVSSYGLVGCYDSYGFPQIVDYIALGVTLVREDQIVSENATFDYNVTGLSVPAQVSCTLVPRTYLGLAEAVIYPPLGYYPPSAYIWDQSDPVRLPC